MSIATYGAAAVRATVQRGELTIDLTGCDPQCKGRSLRRALIESCCFYAIIGLIDPTLRYSDGAREVVRIVTKPGSVVDARPPAAASTYITSSMKLMDVLLAALGPFKPERAIAHSGGTGGAMTLAWHGEPRRANQYEIFGSTYGAAANGDGLSGVTVHLSNIRGTPVEILESEFPCRLRRFELIPDSGGAGRHRGGMSFRREYEVLAPATLIYRCDRAKFAPQGLSGGCGAPKPSHAPSWYGSGTNHAVVVPRGARAGRHVQIRAAAGGGLARRRAIPRRCARTSRTATSVLKASRANADASTSSAPDSSEAAAAVYVRSRRSCSRRRRMRNCATAAMSFGSPMRPRACARRPCRASSS